MNYVRLQLLLCSVLVIIVSAYGCSSIEHSEEKIAKEEFFNYTAHFCSREDCTRQIITELHSAKESVKCAFYAVDERVIMNISSSAATAIVIDKNAKTTAGDFGNLTIRKANSKGIMHNKYCVIDNSIILTGSFNPTAAAKSDYNNLIIINSTALASFYGGDFEKLERSNDKKTPTAAAVASQKAFRKTTLLNTTAVEVLFCPEDDCASAVIKQLRKANSSIVFASYSFTHPDIANELIIKRSEGVAVSGVIEKSATGSKHSKHSAMAANGIDVKLESSKRLMHHKFFVIDNETVITGSFNPTMNADERNDENLIIIRSKKLAGDYTSEFYRIYNSIT